MENNHKSNFPVFPLFGNQLFTTLGIDWGIGLLAFLSLGIGAPVLPLVSNVFRLLNMSNFSRCIIMALSCAKSARGIASAFLCDGDSVLGGRAHSQLWTMRVLDT